MSAQKTLQLLKDHQHGGVKYPPGTVLTMDARLVDWLIAQGVGTATKDSSTRTPNPPVRRASCCGGRW